ncbi:hypothetical protein [Jeotgalibacillus marinus]|uniref:Stage VI sporulation protein D N-terminal domain-containing protein n=1 Tax=Jeotgalibacillus marinus TaxID=86667 RepID=A0ABV3PZR3_9BACL
MKNNQMPLTLKETIIMDGEFGLKELRSLSFEPSVSITEHADHVLIEGSLHLAGEGVASVGSRFDEEANESYERIHVINHSGDEQLDFEHYFPITVNVASERVANVHLLDVYIDHIDYELKDERVLFIHADIVVDGVTKAEETIVVQPEVAEVTPDSNYQMEVERDVKPEEEIHELPIRLLPNPLKEWNQPSGGIEAFEGRNELDVEEMNSYQNDSYVEDAIEPKVADADSYVNEDAIEPKIADSYVKEDAIEPEIAGSSVQDEPLVEMRATPPLESLVNHQTHIEEEQQTAEADNQEAERFDVTDDQALMSFVSTLEDEMTTIKVHITQQDETPEEIAERYGVSMIQLMKTNQFESRAPFDRGRLVWIP